MEQPFICPNETRRKVPHLRAVKSTRARVSAALAVAGVAALVVAVDTALGVSDALRSWLNGSLLTGTEILLVLSGALLLVGAFLLGRRSFQGADREDMDAATLREVVADLTLLRAVGRALAQGEDLETVLEVLAAEAGKAFSGRSATVYRLNEDGQYLEVSSRDVLSGRMAKISEIIRRPLSSARVPLDRNGWYAHVLRSSGPVTTDDPSVIRAMMGEFEGAERYQRFFPAIAQALGMGAVLAAAIRSGDTAIGLIDVARREPFSEQDVERFRIVVGECAGILRLQQLIKALAESEERLKALSLMDQLTGLYNRRGFFLLADQQLRTASRMGDAMTLVYGDVDGLKTINDTHGHAEGDRALEEVGRLLRASFRESDVVSRLGGDEFAVLALETSDSGPAASTARFLSGVDEWNDQRSVPWKLSVSLGFARYDPGAPQSLDELIGEADQRMYEAKRRRTPVATRTS